MKNQKRLKDQGVTKQMIQKLTSLSNSKGSPVTIVNAKQAKKK